MIYLIVNPLQPNAEFDVKISSAFISDTVFWVFVGIALGLCLILCIFGRSMCRSKPNLASQDANQANIQNLDSDNGSKPQTSNEKAQSPIPVN